MSMTIDEDGHQHEKPLQARSSTEYHQPPNTYSSITHDPQTR